MAVAVTTKSSNTATSSTTVVVTKPVGLAVGDGMIAVVSSYSTFGASVAVDTPSGWVLVNTTATSMGSDNGSVSVFARTAASGDVAASNFTFTSTSTSVNMEAVILRATAVRTDVAILDVEDTDFTDNSADPTFTISATPTQITELYVIGVFGATNETYATASAPVINGTNPSWTEQYGGNMQVFTAPVTTTAEVTTADFTVSNSSGGTDWIFSFSSFRGQSSASTTPTFTTTTQVAFAPAGSAGAQTTPTFTETTNTAFAPTGKGTTGTAWVNESKPSTTWTNEEI